MNSHSATVSRRRWLALRLVVGLFIIGVRLSAAPRFARADEDLDRLVGLVDQRLALMPEVAAWKFRRQQPVADPAREREVLEKSVADALAVQLDGTAAREFFAVQILLARAVQEHLSERWRVQSTPPPVGRDLVTALRPRLDAIGRELLPAIYRAANALADTPLPELSQRIAPLRRHPGLTDELLAELTRALGALRIVAAPTWQSVQRAGILRIGTTGDYAPFSDDRGGELRGLDVELAEALAQAWGVKVVFMRTTWASLMDDLGRRRFDLALSGISVTPERSARAGFSVPYHVDGKTPIARREDAARFSTLEKIDQPGVRVIVNPGGTNERFTREHLKRATIVVHPDNRTIFEEILAGRADIMVTDGVEVRLQARRHPALAGTMAAPFTRAGKAILLPAGSELTARVDAWLAPQVEGGQIAAMLQQAVEAAR